MADRSVNGRRTTHRWCLVLLVTMSFVLAASAPAARAERFNLAPGQAHTSVSKPGTDGTERRRGDPVETITVPPGGSAVTTTSFVSGQEYRVVARDSVGASNADGSYAYDWFYLHECSPFPSQCEPFTGGIPEEYSRIWVSDKTRTNLPLTAFASGGQFAWPAYRDGHAYPLTITSADGRLTITDAFPSFGYSTAGETGSWKLDVFPSDAAFGELPDPGFYYPPRGTRDSKEVAATLEGSKARFSFVGSKCSSHNVNFDYSLGVLHAKPVRVNRTTGKFSDTVGAVSENGSRDDKWVEAKFTGRFFPRQVRGTLKLTVDSKKKPKCEAKWDFIAKVEG